MYFFSLFFFFHTEKTTVIPVFYLLWKCNSHQFLETKEGYSKPRNTEEKPNSVLRHRFSAEPHGTNWSYLHQVVSFPNANFHWYCSLQTDTSILYILKCWCYADMLFHGHPDTSCILLSPGSLSLSGHTSSSTIFPVLPTFHTVHKSAPFCSATAYVQQSLDFLC